MRRLVSFAIIFIAAMCGSTASAQDAPEWANEFLSSWYAASSAKDAELITELYSEDARLNDADGREEIMASFKASFAASTESCPDDGFDGFHVIGPIAAGWGTDTCQVTQTNGEKSFTRTTRWLAIYELQDDGSWLTIRDFFEVVE